LDDIAYIVDLPIYDDYEADFLEKPTACSLSEIVPL
jgi:hypothetical protein